jgi:xanthine dehydrogenase YagR molybdenum-binding subunit
MAASPSTMPIANLIGQPIDRVEGPLKVTGAAKYAAEFPEQNLVHGVFVTSTIAKGRITNIDDSDAIAASGVLAVLTHKNMPRLGSGRRGRSPAMHDDQIHFAGQYVALVVAQTLEQATHASTLLKIDYESQPATVDPTRPIAPPANFGNYSRGNVDAAFAAAPFHIEQTYVTPIESHNPIEPHATIAAWDGPRLTLYDSTQGVQGVRGAVAGLLGISSDYVRVIDPYLGGGFGTKGAVWPNTYLAAIAAQHVGRPVKIAITREQMFTQTGNRPTTIQKLLLAADHDGRLTAISHDATSQAGEIDMWVEGCVHSASFLYSCANVQTFQRVIRTHTPAPCQMRAPGHAPGSFALESAMDELAYAVGIDPLELRLRNYSERDESSNQPFSSKALRECYRLGADRFGWAARKPEPRSMQQGKLLVGMGMATAVYPAGRSSSSASIRMSPGPSVLVSAAAHDIGTGTYTILAQIAAQTLGLPIDRVHVQLGDSSLPRAPGAGGSQTAVTVGSAVLATAQNLVRDLVRKAAADGTSPLRGVDAAKIIAREGRLVSVDDPSLSEPIDAVFARNNNGPVSASGESSGGAEQGAYSRHAWGAHFVSVTVDPVLGDIRVTRYVAAVAAGRILNAKTAASQVQGAIVMGIGMALREQVVYDNNRGTVINPNLADYLLPVNADVPNIECIFADEVDTIVSPLGSKGIGELGICGAAAAIANAVYHATGKRIRELPITCDKVMDV